MHAPGRFLGWALLALALTCPGTVSAECSKDSDCPEQTPICNIFFEDLSARVRTLSSKTTPTAPQPCRAKTPTHSRWRVVLQEVEGPSSATIKGLCVQCVDDCDCGVNQVSSTHGVMLCFALSAS